MRFVKYVFGSYECGGQRMEDAYWIDPTRIVGVRPGTLGHTQTIVMLSGSADITVSAKPETVIELMKLAEKEQHGTLNVRGS